MQRAKTPAVSAGRGRGSVWMFRWGQARGGFPRERRVRCGPQRSRYLCVCLCVCLWWGKLPVLPPVTPWFPARRRDGPGAPHCRSCRCSRAPTGPA